MEEKNFSDENFENEEKPVTGQPEPKGKFRIFADNYAYIYFAIALIAVVIAGYFLLKGKLYDDTMSPQMRQVKQMVTKVRKLEADIQENEDELFTLMRDYKEKTGEELPSMKMLNLSDGEQAILEKRVQEEKDISMKGLLSDILDKNKEIQDMRGEVERLEELLPKPHIVRKGENHYQVAMHFLLKEKGIEKKKAMKLIERALLFDPLVVGFKVWNFYSDNEYGTFITQGTAAISPNEVRRRSKKKLVDARDKAIVERDKLSLDIEALENRRGDIISQLELLNQEKQKLITQVSDLNNSNIEMQKTINSLSYLVDLKKNLKKKGIIQSGFLKPTKLKKVSPEYFSRSIDMRIRDTINIFANDFQKKKIKNVKLFPRYYKEGIDYKVKISKNKKEAELTILDTDKLKNEKVVISVN